MKTKTYLRSFLPSALALASITLTVGNAHADNASWTGAANDGNLWSNPNNWTTGDPPRSSRRSPWSWQHRYF